MNIATSQSHLAERVTRYVNNVPSLSGEALNKTLNSIFGFKSRKMIIGGLVRDLARGGIANRHFDVDVVLDLPADEVAKIGMLLHATSNRFGGFGTVKDGWKIDFWALSTTWAHQEGHTRLHYPVDIIDTTFFNVDAVAYNLEKKSVVMYDDYLDQLRDRILEIKLEPNPSIDGNTVRAIRRLRMWKYRCGPRLAQFLQNNIDERMFKHVIETELRLYGKSYAQTYRGADHLLEDLTSINLEKGVQMELNFEAGKTPR